MRGDVWLAWGCPPLVNETSATVDGAPPSFAALIEYRIGTGPKRVFSLISRSLGERPLQELLGVDAMGVDVVLPVHTEVLVNQLQFQGLW